MSRGKKFSIPLFYPFVNEEMKQAAFNALGEKIITQGKKVDKFEKLLNQTLGTRNLLTVNSGTSALELAYHLSGLKPGDEVITPVFTCSGTNIPLLRRGVKIVFADVKDNLLMNWDDTLKKITPKTKAIINVHLFNQLSVVKNVNVPVIGDAAQYLGKTTGEEFTAYSFQAVKLLTTVDGGALVCKRKKDYQRGKLLRWYGINRDTDKDNIDMDIKEAGFKYHMNDVAAAIGLAALPSLSKWKAKIQKLQEQYQKRLTNIPGIKPIGGSPFLIHTKNRTGLIRHLAKKGVETGLGHRRNDIYSVFGGRRQNLPNMNRLETTYLLLPCRANMSVKEVDFICNTIADERR